MVYFIQFVVYIFQRNQIWQWLQACPAKVPTKANIACNLLAFNDNICCANPISRIPQTKAKYRLYNMHIANEFNEGTWIMIGWCIDPLTKCCKDLISCNNHLVDDFCAFEETNNKNKIWLLEIIVYGEKPFKHLVYFFFIAFSCKESFSWIQIWNWIVSKNQF